MSIFDAIHSESEFNTREDLIDYTMERTGCGYDEAEDFVDQFIQEVYDAEGDMDAICDLCFEFFLCEAKHIAIQCLED